MIIHDLQITLILDLIHLLVSDEQVFTKLQGFVTSFKKEKKFNEVLGVSKKAA